METQSYKLCFIDATIIDAKERKSGIKKAIASRYMSFILSEDIEIEQDGGEWVDFSAAIRFQSTPEELKNDIEELLDREGRNIETWSVLHCATGVMMRTEAD